MIADIIDDIVDVIISDCTWQTYDFGDIEAEIEEQITFHLCNNTRLRNCIYRHVMKELRTEGITL